MYANTHLFYTLVGVISLPNNVLLLFHPSEIYACIQCADTAAQ